MTTSTTGSNIDTSSDIKSISKNKTKIILKNVVDLSLNQNKYLIQSDRKVLFSKQTTFKNDFSTQFQHVLSRQEYSKIIETLNSTIDPVLFKLQINNWLLLIAIIMFPCIIVTSIFASMGKIFKPTIIIGSLSFLIGIFAIFRKTYLDSSLADKVANDIHSFNNRFSHRQISLEYLVTTIYTANRIEYQINLHLIYPIIASTTPEMFSSSSQFLNNNLNSSSSFNSTSLSSSIYSNSGNISNSPASILSPTYHYINQNQNNQQQSLPIYNPVTGREYIYYNQNNNQNNNQKNNNNNNNNRINISNNDYNNNNINEDQYYDIDNSNENTNLINK